MNTDLRRFVLNYLRVVLGTSALVVAVAFVSIPWSLGRHPGEAAPTGVPSAAPRHMT